MTDSPLPQTMRLLEQCFPRCAIALLVAPLAGEPGNRVNYIGNGKREDILAMMQELTARWGEPLKP